MNSITSETAIDSLEGRMIACGTGIMFERLADLMSECYTVKHHG